MAIIDYFGKSIDMVILDDLAVGEIDSDKYLVESNFDDDMFLDICTSEEILLNFGIDVKEISYFN